jgi:hypothetical protein
LVFCAQTPLVADWQKVALELTMGGQPAGLLVAEVKFEWAAAAHLAQGAAAAAAAAP